MPLLEFRRVRSEEHTSELQSHSHLVCRLLLEKKKSTAQPSRPRRESRRPDTEERHGRAPAAAARDVRSIGAERAPSPRLSNDLIFFLTMWATSASDPLPPTNPPRC